MATGIANEASPRTSEYADFVERQIRKTRGQVKSVDLAGHVMTLVAGVLTPIWAIWLAMRAPDIWVGPEAMSSVEEAPYDPER